MSQLTLSVVTSTTNFNALLMIGTVTFINERLSQCHHEIQVSAMRVFDPAAGVLQPCPLVLNDGQG